MNPTSIALGLALLVPTALAAQDRITGAPFATRSEVLATGGMAATSQPLATQAALEILRAGGNAVDAAIAANAVLGLTEPTGSGIGGDLFAIVWDAEEGRLFGLNGSGRSPRSLTLEEFERRGLKSIPPHGPLPVSVPGCVDGWFTLHERFGELPMERILAPAIGYAREGFPVTQTIAYYWQASARILHPYPGFREQMTIDGRGPEEGEIWRNENLARTYEVLVAGGRDAFYEGDIARTIAAFMAENDGFLTYEDLAAHHSEWVEPVGVDYRGHTLWELPPNGQGIAAQQILQVLEGYDIAAMGLGSAQYLHLFVEAKKLAFEDRARLYADPDFFETPIARLVSDEYAAERRALIGERASKHLPSGFPDQGDTVYLCTADAAGNMVSLIQSNYRGMGSGMTPTGLGFVLQDRGELFDLTPGRANSYAPGKRPFHTIIPAFLTRADGARMAFGVMGGATQPQMHAQIVVDLVDFGLGLQEAGDTPRLIHSGSSQPTGERMEDGGVVNLESGFAPEVVRELMHRGHRIEWARGPYGGYQAIWRDPQTGVLRGASESRKDGHAAGF
ncbi:gamma-glutamyltransferase family protein [Engelhardtia mirabilis]|uniref:Gamma-glutamyltransferase YwrD n=1 Tax=Engelhardtia mirabilis TaxID=2528011 RepID=A0A518BHZ3_9BACT|nr:Putative gamma-glutamyltransferase YwrD [Planctomycetes bacterium Pla133]QDV00900.1 Putative gamma-glutamyltransferase YwrD [Planctomycetes bacterium Pla86]